MALAGPFLVDGANRAVLAVSHLALLALLWHWARDRDPFERFYMRVWALFFLEYVVLPLACVV